jgi:FlaA1/EpsC-like NDP-sugar epimerase
LAPFSKRSALEAWLQQLLVQLVSLSRYKKRTILAVSDFVLLSLALWVAMSLRWGEFYVPPSGALFLLLLAAPVIGVATFFQMRLYRLVTRFIGGKGAVRIAAAVSLSVLIWALAVLLSGMSGIPRSVVILYGLLGIGLVWTSRHFAAALLKDTGLRLAPPSSEKARVVLIYGAGKTGAELLQALRQAGNYEAIGFVDLNPTMWGQYIDDLKVYRPERLPSLIQRNGVEEVLLAMPKAQRSERRTALRQLESLSVAVRTLPAIEDVAAGRVTVSDLRPVEAEDLLGRDPVPPNRELLGRNIAGKSVLVTGAGGSIGSELVRQVLQNTPRRLVLLDVGEAALHEVQLQVEELLHATEGSSSVPEIVSVLGSVQDERLVESVIADNRVETIYHAAAYKHVPIVEHNPVVGLSNNTFATATLAEAAERLAVERFVLISTDKAVRPTSIMGASKRLAELILQARAGEGRGRTVFTMVRFGNVLDSSGSVVRRFRRQIKAGGPVTVTHRNMIRYFMSIPEAASLVIQAGAMAQGGDVFVLDMGEPVRIDDLAKSMIRLMGLEVRDEEHPDGDIAIEYVGLRPGEKMHEELLLGENTTRTEHPRILKSHEPFLSAADLDAALRSLREAMAEGDVEAIQAILMRTVEGYGPERRQSAPEPHQKAAAALP